MTVKRWIVTISSLTMLTAAVLATARAETGDACPGAGQPIGVEQLTRTLDDAAVVGVSGGVLTAVQTDGSVFLAPTGAPGLARHVAWSAGHLAYVVDRPGPDELVVVRDGATRVLAPGGEVTHPAWSADGRLAYAVDLARIEILERDGRISVPGAPAGTAGVFSPVFDGQGRMFVVAQETVAGTPSHDDTLDNLFTLTPGGWTRLTAFTADADRWSVVRTPVTDGSRVLFVRESGLGSATRPPSSELWEIGATGARLVRPLSGEAYLAAVGDPGIVWNVDRGGEWRLMLERPDGWFEIGCGGVMVDPRSEMDPDRAPEAEVRAPEKGELPAVELGPDMGILIGDFATRVEAETWAGLVDPAASVVENATAPFAVAPGAFAVAIPLPATSDGLGELDALRTRFPELEERSWISWLGGA